ncbi:hypothetical protein [Microbacterium sp. NIBRBAC000506063]|uniref:hypothetical protein n=1 Tax=Microbacterium sp. NIBRBAC000506063 TaxID=2734618 RepID=UPI001BB56ADF|nr:hypothetical protein [Microbacterium sp. NIBRBAC000506063]QTV80093.1 hypothetical protein KAE78_03075 [Microbacterium sp. NIBRBAC000506063]
MSGETTDVGRHTAGSPDIRRILRHPDAGCRMPDAGCRMPAGGGCPVGDAG